MVTLNVEGFCILVFSCQRKLLKYSYEYHTQQKLGGGSCRHETLAVVKLYPSKNIWLGKFSVRKLSELRMRGNEPVSHKQNIERPAVVLGPSFDVNTKLAADQ